MWQNKEIPAAKDLSRKTVSDSFTAKCPEISVSVTGLGDHYNDDFAGWPYHMLCIWW